jgi:hypothetical protein
LLTDEQEQFLDRIEILFLLGVVEEREMLKWMVLMNENQSDSHRSEQRFRILRNYGTGPGLSRLTMPAK